jgi:hypothetical protein
MRVSQSLQFEQFFFVFTHAVCLYVLCVGGLYPVTDRGPLQKAYLGADTHARLQTASRSRSRSRYIYYMPPWDARVQMKPPCIKRIERIVHYTMLDFSIMMCLPCSLTSICTPLFSFQKFLHGFLDILWLLGIEVALSTFGTIHHKWLDSSTVASSLVAAALLSFTVTVTVTVYSF